MTKDSAKRVSDLFRSLVSELNESVRAIQECEAEDELKKYRVAVSHIMGTMWDQVMGPLYAEHPELEPPEFKA